MPSLFEKINQFRQDQINKRLNKVVCGSEVTEEVKRAYDMILNYFVEKLGPSTSIQKFLSNDQLTDNQLHFAKTDYETAAIFEKPEKNNLTSFIRNNIFISGLSVAESYLPIKNKSKIPDNSITININATLIILLEKELSKGEGNWLTTMGAIVQLFTGYNEKQLSSNLSSHFKRFVEEADNEKSAKVIFNNPTTFGSDHLGVFRIDKPNLINRTIKVNVFKIDSENGEALKNDNINKFNPEFLSTTNAQCFYYNGIEVSTYSGIYNELTNLKELRLESLCDTRHPNYLNHIYDITEAFDLKLTNLEEYRLFRGIELKVLNLFSLNPIKTVLDRLIDTLPKNELRYELENHPDLEPLISLLFLSWSDHGYEYLTAKKLILEFKELVIEKIIGTKDLKVAFLDSLISFLFTRNLDDSRLDKVNKRIEKYKVDFHGEGNEVLKKFLHETTVDEKYTSLTSFVDYRVSDYDEYTDLIKEILEYEKEVVNDIDLTNKLRRFVGDKAEDLIDLGVEFVEALLIMNSFADEEVFFKEEEFCKFLNKTTKKFSGDDLLALSFGFSLTYLPLIIKNSYRKLIRDDSSINSKIQWLKLFQLSFSYEDITNIISESFKPIIKTTIDAKRERDKLIKNPGDRDGAMYVDIHTKPNDTLKLFQEFRGLKYIEESLGNHFLSHSFFGDRAYNLSYVNYSNINILCNSNVKLNRHQKECKEIYITFYTQPNRTTFNFGTSIFKNLCLSLLGLNPGEDSTKTNLKELIRFSKYTQNSF